ncbi:MAG: hypothetical protein K5785_01035 [Nitrosarchaeum sp.]|nr:hypothetical protein [Nitrosarchaeum sp.]
MSSREDRDKLEFQARIARETKMPKPLKKSKMRLLQKTEESKNQEHFDYLENL